MTLTGTRGDEIPPDLDMAAAKVAIVDDVDSDPGTWDWLDADWDGAQWQEVEATGIVSKHRVLRTADPVEFVGPIYAEPSFYVYAKVPTDPETTIARAGVITLDR